MNVLVLGNGKGSWQVRGEQLGTALGARVLHDPTPADWAWADVVTLVKRAERYLPAAREAGVPVVWDALDCWKQPADDNLSEVEAVARFRAQIAAIRPALTLGATQAQAAAAGGVYLPHHSWPGLEPAPPREVLRVVAYQGNPAYLGAWTGRTERACAVRGWRFAVNPSDLREADLLVALREGPWDGWMCREWKSGVKLVNAIAAGRPILTQATAAAREIRPPGSIIETEADLVRELDTWASPTLRAIAFDQCCALAPTYRVAAVAERLRGILEQVRVATCVS